MAGMASWIMVSGLTRAIVTGFRPEAILRGITKATIAAWDGTNGLDIYYPTATSSRPVVAILHGSWCNATANWRAEPGVLSGLAKTFAWHGFCAVVPDFLQVTGCTGNVDTSHRQGQITSILNLVAWIRANIATYNGNPTKVVLIGQSAGGHLAYMAGIQGVTGGTKPNGVIGWSPATRLDRIAYASGQAHSQVGPYINNYLAVTDQSTGADAVVARTFSPYDQVSSNLPPMRIVGGSAEVNLGIQKSDFDDMYSVAVAAGVDTTEVIYTTTTHADFRSFDDYASMVWIDSKVPWTKTSSRSTAGTRANAGTRAAA